MDPEKDSTCMAYMLGIMQAQSNTCKESCPYKIWYTILTTLKNLPLKFLLLLGPV